MVKVTVSTKGEDVMFIENVRVQQFFLLILLFFSVFVFAQGNARAAEGDAAKIVEGMRDNVFTHEYRATSKVASHQSINLAIGQFRYRFMYFLLANGREICSSGSSYLNQRRYVAYVDMDCNESVDEIRLSGANRNSRNVRSRDQREYLKLTSKYKSFVIATQIYSRYRFDQMSPEERQDLQAQLKTVIPEFAERIHRTQATYYDADLDAYVFTVANLNRSQGLEFVVMDRGKFCMMVEKVPGGPIREYGDIGCNGTIDLVKTQGSETKRVDASKYAETYVRLFIFTGLFLNAAVEHLPKQ